MGGTDTTEPTKDKLEMIALKSYDDFSRYAAQKILDLYGLLAEKDVAIYELKENNNRLLNDIRAFIDAGWYETAQTRIESALKGTGEGNE